MLIGSLVFGFCTSLSRVVLIDGLTILGVNMFYMQGVATLLSSITIPSTVTNIGRDYYDDILETIMIIINNNNA